MVGTEVAVRPPVCANCTLEVERSGLAVEALDLSNAIKTFSKREVIKHVDAQRRVHPKP